MKSYIIAVLFVIVIINSVFAQYSNQFNQGQTEYEREQAIIQSEMAPANPAPQPVQPIQPPVAPPVQPQASQPIAPPVQPVQPQASQPIAQPVQPIQPIQPVQPVQQDQPIQPTQPTQPEVQQPIAQVESPQPVQESVTEEKKEGSSHAGTLAVTGVAFALIAGVGYKNYKKDSKFKLPELPVIPGINAPKDAANNEVVVEMEVLLNESSEAENFSLAKNRAYKCMISWTPKQSDEIILRRGDLVCVKECYNDGYTLGRNLSTKFDGIFPTCCLCRSEQNIIGCELVKNGKFTAIPKRVSSKNRRERRARRASRGVSFLSTVPVWNKAGFTSIQ